MMDSRLRGNDGQDLCIGMLIRKPCAAAHAQAGLLTLIYCSIQEVKR